MKWFFRIIAFIFAAFVLLCIGGAFLPATQRVDVTITMPVDGEDIYAVISDLKTYPQWSGVGGPESHWVFGGAEDGVGQTAVWQVENALGDRFGSLEILQVEAGQYVRVGTIGPLGEQTVTLAVDEGPEVTTFLLESERELGGFPYFGRIAAIRQKAGTEAALNSAAHGLADLLR